MPIGKLPDVRHPIGYLTAYCVIECECGFRADVLLYVFYNASELVKGFGRLRIQADIPVVIQFVKIVN